MVTNLHARKVCALPDESKRTKASEDLSKQKANRKENKMSKGYQGKVTLVSPSGSESVEISLPGRHRMKAGQYDYSSSGHLKTAKVSLNSGYHSDSRKIAERQNRRFKRLISKGWKIVACNGKPVSEEKETVAGEEEKKQTDLVIGITKSGNASHGGDHASAEVEDSPNAAKEGKQKRKCRGGQKHRRKNTYGRNNRVRIQVQKCSQQGGGAVYAPQPLCVSNGLLESAEKSAELLARLVGRSHIKIKRGVVVNAEKLLVALEIGDNPLPPLENPDERPKIKILVTPDCSGSCQSWSGLGQAWAMHLSKIPDVDVIYFDNFNGEFWDIADDAETKKLIESVDVVLYLGDGDGGQLCERYASFGATVLALDSYCARYANPRLNRSKPGKGVLYWVDRVSTNEPDTWARAIELCFKP